jgi:ATP-dependent DNA helicase PIF1
MLNPKQKKALEEVKKGANVFITGSPGTGKSFLCNEIRNYLNSARSSFGLTAMTGSAAFLIEGRTLHSFLSIGLAKKEARDLASDVRRRPAIAEMLQGLDCLIIDEVSMLGSKLFEKVDIFLRLIRHTTESFGGIQMIFIGDFCQLSPINDEYCFTHPVWNKLNLVTVFLIELVRQKGDQKFQSILQEIRFGQVSNKTFDTLQNLSTTVFSSEVQPTKLYCTRASVETINDKHYDLLKTMRMSYPVRNLKKGFHSVSNHPENIEIREGCQVVLTYNLCPENGLVNGTRGLVQQTHVESVVILDTRGRTHTITYVQRKDETGQVLFGFMPLKLAWALTVHRSQGMTLDCVEMDLGTSVFANGQAYTALSRAKDMSSIKILDLCKKSLELCDPKVVKFYSECGGFDDVVMKSRTSVEEDLVSALEEKLDI